MTPEIERLLFTVTNRDLHGRTQRETIEKHGVVPLVFVDVSRCCDVVIARWQDAELERRIPPAQLLDRAERRIAPWRYLQRR